MFFNAVEESLYHLAFAGTVSVHKGMDPQPFGIAEHHADDQDALQVQRHEITLPLLLALGPPGPVDLLVAGFGGFPAQGAQAGYVGNGLDIKDENGPGHKVVT